MKKIFAVIFVSAIIQVLLAGCTSAERITKSGEVIYKDDFKNLDNWHFEGLVNGATNPQPGIMRLDCTGSRQNEVGLQAICKTDFPDNIKLEYDLFVEDNHGLVITFIAMKGNHGEDAITGVPPRKGIFPDYIRGSTRSYHVSVSRYNDEAVHTGHANWRRNPGIYMMASGPDPCKQIRKWYHIAIVKDGPRVQLYVDGKPAVGFVDPQTIKTEMPTDGKIGFRVIGSKAIAKISNFKVSSLKK